VLGKVEVPIGVVGQKSMSVGIGCCGFEHGVQIWVERFGFGDEGEERNEEIYRSTHRVWTGDRRWSWPGSIDLCVRLLNSLMHQSGWVFLYYRPGRGVSGDSNLRVS
jgi:hypothetical protein